MVRQYSVLIGTAALLCASVVPTVAFGPNWTDTCADGRCKCAAVGDLKRADCSNASLVSVPKNLSSEVQSLDVSHNAISELGSDAFSAAGLADLRILTIRNCSVVYVDRDAFRGLEALAELDLSDNRVATLDPATFQYTVRLQKISLNGNAVATLNDGLFANLSLVREVELNECMLTAIQPETFRDAVMLNHLKLNGNRLTNIAVQVLSSMPSLRSLDISYNPWKCDCDLRPFSDLVIHKKLFKPNVSCAEPEGLRGKQWDEIKPEEFICKPVIQYPPQNGSLEFIDQVPWMIGCKVHGDPIPKIQWLLNNHIVLNNSNSDYILNKSMAVNNTRWINITWLKSQWMESSEFKCIAINAGGSDERKFTVVVKNMSKIDNEPGTRIKSSSDFYHVLIISSTLIVSFVIVLLIIFYKCYCRQLIKKPLSDTEFVHMNQLLVKMAEKKSLTTGVVAGNESSDDTSSDQPDLSLGEKADTLPWDGHVQHSSSEESSVTEDDSWKVPKSHMKACS